MEEIEYVDKIHKIALERSLEDVKITDIIIASLQSNDINEKNEGLKEIAEILKISHFVSDIHIREG